MNRWHWALVLAVLAIAVASVVHWAIGWWQCDGRYMRPVFGLWECVR